MTFCQSLGFCYLNAHGFKKNSTAYARMAKSAVARLVWALWLHHNHKMSISYHNNGFVSSHQPVGRWFIFMCFLVRIFLMKLVGSQQPTCLCVNCQGGIRGWKHFAFIWIVFTFVELFSFMWGRHICARKMVFRFTCAVLWKLRG